MPTNQVDTVTFDLLERASQPVSLLAPQPVVLERPGIDGHASVVIGERGEPFTWLGLKWDSSRNNALAHVAAVRALRGSVVTIYDEGGTQTSNVEVIDVRVPLQPQAVWQSGSQKWQTITQLTLLVTE